MFAVCLAIEILAVLVAKTKRSNFQLHMQVTS